MIKESIFYFMIGLNIALLYLFINSHINILQREKIKKHCF